MPAPPSTHKTSGAPVKDTEYLCFSDAKSRTAAQRSALKLPKTC